MRRIAACSSSSASALLPWSRSTSRRPAPTLLPLPLSSSRRYQHPAPPVPASPRGLSTTAPPPDAEALHSAFLQSLLDPPETTPLVDATRTYRTMDVVEDAQRYDPATPNVSDAEALAQMLAEMDATVVDHTSTSASSSTRPLHTDGDNADEDKAAFSTQPRGPLATAHTEGRLWSCFASATDAERASNQPPQWFEALCRDLFFRTDSSSSSSSSGISTDPVPSTQLGLATTDTKADGALLPPADFSPEESHRLATSPPPSGPTSATDTDTVDPYTWLPFDLFDEQSYRVQPYRFPATATYTLAQRLKLCLGQPLKEYVHFANTYAFPARHQLPTSLGTQPARLHVDPSSPAQVVYLQLSEDFPPAMWLPVKGTAAAVRRVLSEYAEMATVHRDRHHDSFSARYADAQRVMALQQLPTQGPEGEGDVLRFMAYEARNTPYWTAPLREFRNQQDMFLGEYDDPEWLVEHLDLCPYVFSMAHMRTVTNPHKEHMTPTVQGPGVASSLFRCVFSKALIMVNVQLSAEVKLPPQDPEAFEFLWKDSQVVPKMKIPVFVRVMWPDNHRLCANGLLNQRLNRLFNLELAPDMPPDAALTLLYVSQWAKRLPDLLGVRGMRQRVAELEAASHMPEPPRLYPGTRELPNPEYTVAERLGMHVQYLSELGDPDIAETIRQLLPQASAPVRMGCAKAALIAGERDLFRQIVSSEPAGRMQLYMTKLVRKRKTRDLVDPEPRLLDEQYEFAAPLWTKKGTRIDRNTLEGAVDAARLRSQ